MSAYYNEIDPFAAAWLRELMKNGLIAPGEVDERSIEDVRPSDLSGFTQCHFFAGIGVWSHALRQAGWPDDRPVWTGSCPCQPFSAAGKGAGFDDERHLWPDFHWLIGQCRPPVVLGEQVESKAGRAWLDLVQADLEGSGYAVGAVAFPAAGVGSPHIRSRMFWVADSKNDGWNQRQQDGGRSATRNGTRRSTGCSDDRTDGGLADAQHPERRPVGVNREDGCDRPDAGRQEAHGEPGACGEVHGLADAKLYGPFTERKSGEQEKERQMLKSQGRSTSDGGLADSERQRTDGGYKIEKRSADTESGMFGELEAAAWPDSELGGLADAEIGRFTEQRGAPLAWSSGHADGDEPMVRPAGPVNGFWRAADWLFCRDGKWRPVEPGTFPLVDGAPDRVGRLRGYGNAINAEAAKAFIEAYMQC